MIGILVLLRHGQSTWNEQNLFTGWHDVPLTELGRQEAQTAGEVLKQTGIVFDHGFTSLLGRAIETNNIVLAKLDQNKMPVTRDWHLNERHYGALQGLDKKATTVKFGFQQTNIWRRSYAQAPPPVEQSNPEHPSQDQRYRHIALNELPATECLKDVVDRVVPFFNEHILPILQAGKHVLITAHGNSLRALVMHLEQLSPEQIAEFNIPTGVPRQYKFANGHGHQLLVASVEFLGDQTAIAKASQTVANQANEPNH